MLKKRIVAVVIVLDGIAVQSMQFRRYLPLGKPRFIVEQLNSWGVDEIALVDISASKRGTPSLDLVRETSTFCQVPLTYGGGISTVDQMVAAVHSGADKVMLNQLFLQQPDLISSGAKKLGQQCLVVSIDLLGSGALAKSYDYFSRRTLSQSPVEFARLAECLGAGELFINSVDRDGSKCGFDLDTARKIADSVSIPVVLCGGAGVPQHFKEALSSTNVSGIAAANYFAFSEHSVTMTKSFLKDSDILVRHDTYFTYEDSTLDTAGRLLKKSDQVLKNMLFEYHEKEVI